MPEQPEYRSIRGWGRRKNLDKPLFGRGVRVVGLAAACLGLVAANTWRGMWEFHDGFWNAFIAALVVLVVLLIPLLAVAVWSR